jgi:hypothetical protein
MSRGEYVTMLLIVFSLARITAASTAERALTAVMYRVDAEPTVSQRELRLAACDRQRNPREAALSPNQYGEIAAVLLVRDLDRAPHIAR